ncbi:hypothetical protein Prudu_004020, partial [Prunus dulcis]
RPFDFQAAARPPQAEPISAVGTYGSASVSPSQPDQSPPRAALSWPENRVFRRSSKFSFVSPPNRSSKVVEVHRIHHRATLSLRASKSGENFGIGQNTGETAEFSAEV